MAGKPINLQERRAANLNAVKAKQILADVAKVSRKVRLSFHAKQRMQERDITLQQVIRVMQRGNITEGPYWEATKANWKMNISGISAGTEITISVALELADDSLNDYAVVVTVFQEGI